MWYFSTNTFYAVSRYFFFVCNMSCNLFLINHFENVHEFFFFLVVSLIGLENEMKCESMQNIYTDKYLLFHRKENTNTNKQRRRQRQWNLYIPYQKFSLRIIRHAVYVCFSLVFAPKESNIKRIYLLILNGSSAAWW